MYNSTQQINSFLYSRASDSTPNKSTARRQSASEVIQANARENYLSNFMANYRKYADNNGKAKSNDAEDAAKKTYQSKTPINSLATKSDKPDMPASYFNVNTSPNQTWEQRAEELNKRIQRALDKAGSPSQFTNTNYSDDPQPVGDPNVSKYNTDGKCNGRANGSSYDYYKEKANELAQILNNIEPSAKANKSMATAIKARIKELSN